MAPPPGGAKCNSAPHTPNPTPQTPQTPQTPTPFPNLCLNLKPITQPTPHLDLLLTSLLGEVKNKSIPQYSEPSSILGIVTLVSDLITVSSRCIYITQVQPLCLHTSQINIRFLTRVIKSSIKSGVFQIYVSKRVFNSLFLCRTLSSPAMTKSPPPSPMRSWAAEASRPRSHNTSSSPSSCSSPGLRRLRSCKKKKKNISTNTNENSPIVQQLNEYFEIIICHALIRILKPKLPQEYNTISRGNSQTFAFSLKIVSFAKIEVRRYSIYVDAKGKTSTTEGHCKAMKYVTLNRILGISSVGLEFLRNFLQVAQSFEFIKEVSPKVINRPPPWYSTYKKPTHELR